MRMFTRFSKYQGAGNDFILIEDFEEKFPKGQVPFLCDRHFGIGADGLILARRSQVADFEMVYFNADGSNATMCGNGLRCFALFLNDLGYKKSLYKIEISGQILTVLYKESLISTVLPVPRVLFWDKKCGNRKVYVVDSGVPHAVIFSQEEVDVEGEGKKIRHHEMFAPSGVNVNFVYQKDLDQLEISTYERGVEGETLACGTGALAAAFVANQLQLCKEEVNIITRSKAVIHVKMGEEMVVTGPSLKVFEGQVNY